MMQFEWNEMGACKLAKTKAWHHVMINSDMFLEEIQNGGRVVQVWSIPTSRPVANQIN